MPKQKPEETVTIKIHGSRKFQQAIVDKIYQALMDEELQFEATKGSNGFTLEASLEPSENETF